MTEYYKDMLEKGLQYQDFVTSLLLKEIALPISTYSSKKYQISHGENAQGVEIKFDDKMCETGNVYIEVSEKSNANNTSYVPSGIYRLDNTWLYVIGDYSVVYIFAKKFLILMHKTGKYRTVKIPTSQGFLIDCDDTSKYCIKKIEVSNGT